MTGVLVWAGIGAAGGLGAIARFLVDAAISTRRGGLFPFGTFVVNLSGSLALGLLIGFALRGDALLVAGTGAIGGYTTFSTWMLEFHRLGEDGEEALGALNVALSIAAGLAAVAAGRAIGDLL
ncbi:MAG: fluoride exporter [Solirubrobacteraceae bacterium]|nr:fluoride exporter [Solirubrobacteraceae bacterium]